MKNTRENRAKFRRANRVLSMVLHLHKWGYQKIRIAPGLSVDGNDWECAITHARNIDRTDGARLAEDPHDGHIAYYTTASSNEYFGWNDAQLDNSRELGERFIQRFPRILSLGNGVDWAYSGWYLNMLGVAENGSLPIDYGNATAESRRDLLSTVSLSDKTIFLQAPPI